MNNANRLLLIEDDHALAISLVRVLEGEGYVVDHVATGDAGYRLACSQRFAAALTDLRLPGMGGMEVVQRLHDARPHLPVILLTAHGTAETAIEATKRGAYDYLLKPFAMPDLLAIVARALAQSRGKRGPGEDALPPAAAGQMVGRSRAMQELFKEIGRVASQQVTVLIVGETGTGKEMIARAIWRHSGREKKPFIAINCAAIPDTLLESELFGHERGAFTGADARRIGRFEQAHGGTIFLDEIGDVSPATQVRLLRVLQENCIERVGGRESIPIDVRVIAATHCDLEAAIHQGRFREDLYYRLSVVKVHSPPLRERREDIELLAMHFATVYAQKFKLPPPTLRPEAIARLQQHGWPGNVRELENVIRRTLLATRGFAVDGTLISEALTDSISPPPASPSTPLSSIVDEALRVAAQVERGEAHAAVIAAAEAELLRQALERTHGNQTRAARLLGLSRLTLREKLQRFGLRAPAEPDRRDRVA